MLYLLQVIMRIWPPKGKFNMFWILMALKFKDLVQILIGEQRLLNNSTQLNGKAIEEQLSPH